MSTHRGVWVAAGVWLILAAGVVGAQDVTPQNKLLAMRAAQADALRKLAEQIYGLRIDAETTVKDFVTESDVIRTQVKAFLRGAKMVGRPRYYSDGACDVDYEMTLATVITNLKRIADGYVKKGKFKGDYFEQITKHTKLTKIVVTGSGAPREDVDYGDAVDGGLATGVLRSSMQPRKVPAGWEDVTAQGRLMALRGAQVDAYRQIAERVIGVLVASETEVKDFVTEMDLIRTFARGRLVGVKITGHRFMCDQVAEVDCEMTLETLVTTVKTIVDGKVKHGKFTGDYLRQVFTKAKLTKIKATGRSVPAARFIRGSTSTVGIDEPPAWTANVVKATGTGAVDQAMLAENAAQAWLNAERAATLDGLRKLGEQVDGLRIDSTTLVKDFVAEHDAIRSDMNTFIRGARIVAKRRLDDGTAEVDVELPLERLWLIVKRVK